MNIQPNISDIFFNSVHVLFKFFFHIVGIGFLLRIVGVRVMMFNATFNNISIISWRSVLFVEETGVPGEKHLKR
jgi:hypothetical protein